MPKKSTKSNVKQMWGFIAPYKWGLIIAIAMVFVTSATLSISPMFEGRITTQLVSDVQGIMNGTLTSVHFTAILQTILILAILYAIKTISQVVMSFMLTNAIQNTTHDLRKALQKKIQRLPVRYFDTHKYGDVLSRITNDVDTLSNALQQTLTQIISGILSLILAIIMMTRINLAMTGLTLLLIPASLIITKIIVGKSQKSFRAQQNALGQLNGTITEMYTGFNEIMLYNRQKEAEEKFSESNSRLCQNAFRAQFMSSLISPLISLCTYLCIGSIAVFGATLAISNTISVGNLQAFIRYIWQVNDPLSQISNMSAQIQSAFAALGRIFEVLNEEEEVPEKAVPEVIEEPKGNVTFEHVRFGYYPDNILIQDLNAEIKSGQMVAIPDQPADALLRCARWIDQDRWGRYSRYAP